MRCREPQIDREQQGVCRGRRPPAGGRSGSAPARFCVRIVEIRWKRARGIFHERVQSVAETRQHGGQVRPRSHDKEGTSTATPRPAMAMASTTIAASSSPGAAKRGAGEEGSREGRET